MWQRMTGKKNVPKTLHMHNSLQETLHFYKYFSTKCSRQCTETLWCQSSLNMFFPLLDNVKNLKWHTEWNNKINLSWKTIAAHLYSSVFCLVSSVCVLYMKTHHKIKHEGRHPWFESNIWIEHREIFLPQPRCKTKIKEIAQSHALYIKNHHDDSWVLHPPTPTNLSALYLKIYYNY